jgi:mannose-6-phosphate isomerase-like protein (cupin superfamily)
VSLRAKIALVTIGLVEEWKDEGETSRDRPIAPLHLHRSEDEAWYVLEGTLGFHVGEDEVQVHAGHAVIVQAGTPHSYWNATDSRTRYVIVLGPKTAALIAAIHALDPSERARLPALFGEHDSELLV